MNQRLIIFIVILSSFHLNGQTRFFENADSLHRLRTIAVTTSISTVWAGSIIGLSSIWYSDANKTSFHFFDDSKNWLQMDKVGHIYTANKISCLTGDLYVWGGMKNKPAALTGFGIGVGYQLSFEFLDAYSSDWGFSWSDLGANILGSSVYLAQQLVWEEQRILLKFSTHPTEYAQYRPDVLGSGFGERLLKDYNGQTYWLSASPGAFMKNGGFPKWLCFSVGYSVDEKLVGDQENYIHFGNSPPTALNEFNSKRELLFSLDIDFSQFKIKRPWLRALVKQFNYLKVPFPAVIISGNKVGGSWIYF